MFGLTTNKKIKRLKEQNLSLEVKNGDLSKKVSSLELRLGGYEGREAQYMFNIPRFGFTPKNGETRSEKCEIDAIVLSNVTNHLSSKGITRNKITWEYLLDVILVTYYHNRNLTDELEEVLKCSLLPT